MGERQATIEGVRHDLDGIFFVIATQNPVEFRGTYPLPEAQMDRFGIRLALGYVDAEAEEKLLDYTAAGHPLDQLTPCADVGDLLAARSAAAAVAVAPALRRYIVDLAQATRQHPAVQMGASPRASIALHQLARSLALFDGASFVSPDLIQEIAPHVLAHRLALDPQARYAGTTGADVVREILLRIPVPL
jgi:MoxR-like ATPase